ncbi:UNVERIFIED_CONTAM: Replication factor C subunit 4, partial [Eudyptes robustus]
LPWVEKYRPSQVQEISYQEEVVAALTKCLEGNDLPHMLFYGPPGTGKTTAAQAVYKQLFKDPDTIADRVLELNASDERGIGVVRDRIKGFAKQNVRSTASKKCAASVKIIILDEADAMTSSAQMALRRIMESECRTTRFFIICNYISRIIAPLASRCVKFRFKPLPAEAQIDRLKYIVENENLKITSEALNQLISFSDGDLRKSITRLQSLSLGFDSIESQNVADICGQIPSEQMEKFYKALKGNRVEIVEEKSREFIRNGFSPKQFLEQISELILKDDSLRSVDKARILGKIGEEDARLLDGASPLLVITSLCLSIFNINSST